MSFEVIPSSFPVTAEEWLRARDLPESELPPLDERQKAVAERLRMNDENYSRFRIYLREQVMARQRKQGEAFGRIVAEMIRPFGSTFAVTQLSYYGPPDAWKVVIRNSSGETLEFQSFFNVVQALVDGSAAKEDVDFFRSQLWAQLSKAVPAGAAS